MKKFTILVALILCVTIGGVYATWTYQGGEVSPLHHHFNVYMGQVDNDEAKGILKTVTNALSIRLDDANKDYVAEAFVHGYIEFVFAPKSNATDDVRNNGINLNYTLEQTNPAIQYEVDGVATNVFTITGGTGDLGKGVLITADNYETLSAHGSDLSTYVGSFYYCIEATTINSMISTDVSLPTYDDYKVMETILNTTTAKIGISINEE